MPHAFFHVTEINPNDTTGGGGCVCDPQRQIDCKPPYVMFPGNDMENIASPHVVICASCIGHASKALEGEVLSAGERGDVPATVPAKDVLAMLNEDDIEI